MKFLFIIVMSFSGFASQAGIPAIEEVRTLLQKAVKDKKACKELIKLLDEYNELNHPVLAGYKACATMVMAKHTFNPFSKLSFFSKGKNLLERSIAIDETNAELRFLRYSVQTSVPSFLNYHNNINEDREFLKKMVPAINDPGLKASVVNYLKQR